MGNINKRLLNKLIEKVGWPNLLYQTLKDVYFYSVNNSPGLDEALEEAKDLLEAYEGRVVEEANRVVRTPDAIMERTGFKSPSTDMKVVRKDPSSARNWEDIEEASQPTSPPKGNGREEITRVTVLLPAKESKSQPQELRGVASIDPTIGDCQGVLPISEGCQIVNRDKVRITTRTGAELGRSQVDGQVKGSENVTGRIRTDGRFDLVFKDTKLGEAVIWYEVVGEKKPEERELKMISFLDADSKKWISFIEESEVEARADTIKESKNQLLDVLSKEIGMQIISAVVLKRSEDNKEEIKSPPHIILQPGG